MSRVHVLFMFASNPYGGVEVDTTARGGKYRGLSPFILGPIDTYLPSVQSKNFENLWQFSKVYGPEYVDNDFRPNDAWYEWRDEGFADPIAHRYPMGKSRKPLYSVWGIGS